MISIFGPPSRRVRVKNVIGKLRRNSAVRNETQREIVGSWQLWTLTDFSKMGPDLRKEAFINLCYAIFIHAPYFTYIALSYDMYFQFMIVFINALQCVSAFSFGDDGRRGDRLFSPRNDAQQATRLPHCSVKRDHDALNEGCTWAL